MSDPIDRPSADWDDARIDAAFRAGFDRRPPTGLLERVVAEIRPRPAPAWRWLDVLRTAGSAAAIVLVLAMTATIVGIGRNPGVAGTSVPGGLSTPGGESPMATATADAGEAPWPSEVIDDPTGRPLPVLGVLDAVELRDRGQGATDVAVGGWYRAYAVPCPLWQGPFNPLEVCGLDHTWLTGERDLLLHPSIEPSGSALHPAIHPVTNWIPATTDVPHAVVFIGHFDDPRAASCAPERRETCAARFVVDSVPWTDAGIAATPPTTIAGLPVVTVSEAITVRDSGAATELAVAGWHEPPPVLFCPLFTGSTAGPLMSDCMGKLEWLTQDPEDLFSGRSIAVPTGPAIRLGFPRGTGIPATERPGPPAEYVMVGHFNDRRAPLCPVDTVDACRRVFVVDAVAWRVGQAVLPVVDDLSSTASSLTTAQQAAISAFVDVHAPLITIFMGSGAQLGQIEPWLLGRDQKNGAILGDAPILWMAITIGSLPDPPGPVAETWVIDGAGRLYEADGGAFAPVESSSP